MSIFRKYSLQEGYELSDVIDILKDEGYSISALSDNLAVVKVDGDAFMIFMSNNDLQFVSRYNPDDDFTLRKINKVNNLFKVGKAYLDEDEQLCLEVLVRFSKEINKDRIIQAMKDIISLDRIAILELNK